MTEQKSRKKKISDQLKETYRLIIRNNETFKEVGVFNVNLRNFLISILLATLLFIGLIIFLIAGTPLKQFIPGYGTSSKYSDVYKLNQKISALEGQIEAQYTYINAYKMMLQGKESADIIAEESQSIHPDSIKAVERILEDEMLRLQVERSAQIEDANSDIAQEGTVALAAPIRGSISATYNPSIEHYGIDITAPKNTAVKSAAEGIVVSSEWTLETGNAIAVLHPNGMLTYYKHNASNLKKVGESVSKGEAIAIIGNTGTHTSGPHLHFELWYKGKSINPERYFTFN